MGGTHRGSAQFDGRPETRLGGDFLHQEDLHMDKAGWTPRKMIQWMKYDMQFMKHDLMIQANMYFNT